MLHLRALSPSSTCLCVHTSAFLHLQPAASSLFESCYPISIIFQALPFSNLTRNWISTPAVPQRLSPLYPLCFPVCSPGCLCHSGRTSLFHFWQISSVKLNLAKLLQCQSMYQGSDWGFSQASAAESCWLFLWQNRMDLWGKR